MVSEQDKKDAQTYKDLASKGMDLLFPVRIRGKSHRPDIQTLYHVTIMLFNPEKDTKEDAHEIAKKLPLNPPDPKRVTIKMGTMEGRTGYNLYNIDLIGPENKRIEDLYNEFSSMGYHNNYKFQAHITVDKATWDEFKKENGKTAFEAGIEFLPAELRQGDKILASYKLAIPTDWGKECPAEDKLAASEKWGIVRDTILTNPVLYTKHVKATILDEYVLQRYVEDNPGLMETILKKHEERVLRSFEDAELRAFGIKYGVRKVYEQMRKK
ncbi:MAG TPA: hypothetical protein VN855_00350 [Candidatus Acidoferrum sp.]|nr:hypothetical protein [Candidatus Acidoferrum sp.]